MQSLPVSFEDILAAQERIREAAHTTPVMTSTTANQITNAQLFFKCENFQRTGAFKFRGAYNSLAKLKQTDPNSEFKGVIAYSSGNHAQALALAAQLLKIPAMIVMPEDAPSIKVEATRGYGAEIIFYNRYTQSREDIGKQLATEHNLKLIPPFDYPDVIAGQGTAALELIQDVKNLDVLIAPLGGGGLLSGCALVAKKLNPSCKVIGVEPELGNDAQQSLNQNTIIKIETPKTIADGAQTTQIGQHTFAIMKDFVDEVITVSDQQLIDTMKFIASRMKMVVEPTGSLAAAAALSGALNLKDKKVGIIISGGNVDMTQFANYMQNT